MLIPLKVCLNAFGECAQSEWAVCPNRRVKKLTKTVTDLYNL